MKIIDITEKHIIAYHDGSVFKFFKDDMIGSPVAGIYAVLKYDNMIEPKWEDVKNGSISHCRIFDAIVQMLGERKVNCNEIR